MVNSPNAAFKSYSTRVRYLITLASASITRLQYIILVINTKKRTTLLCKNALQNLAYKRGSWRDQIDRDFCFLKEWLSNSYLLKKKKNLVDMAQGEY